MLFSMAGTQQQWLDTESKSPERGWVVCVGSSWMRVVSIQSCVVDSGISSYMLGIPNGLYYIYES